MLPKIKPKRGYKRFHLSINEVGISESVVANIAATNCAKAQKVQILLAALSGRVVANRRRKIRQFSPDENF